MKTDFNSKLELVRYYSEEDNCKALLAQQRWGDKVTCVHCGHDKVYTTNRGYKCASKTCYKKFTVVSGTIFENTKIPLNKWFEAIFVISAHKKGISSHQLAKDIDVSQKTSWFILHRVREMLKDKNPSILSGMVEADETYIGGKVSNKHKSVRRDIKNKMSPLIKTPVIGLLERNGKVFTQVVKDVNRVTVLPIVKGQLASDAILVTDSSHMYTPIKSTHEHHVINHEQGEYVRGFVHTNGIEGYWSQLKRGIYGVYHQVSPEHLHRYCNEFAFRFNTRKTTDVDRFNSILQLCTGRLTWDQLTEKGK